jgi:hypothetical protein
MFHSEGQEMDGLCWLLKLRWMGTQRVQMKGVPPWLVRWSCRGNTRDFLFCLCCSNRPSTSILIPLSPSSSKPAGIHWVGCLTVCVSGSTLKAPPVERTTFRNCFHIQSTGKLLTIVSLSTFRCRFLSKAQILHILWIPAYFVMYCLLLYHVLVKPSPFISLWGGSIKNTDHFFSSKKYSLF